MIASVFGTPAVPRHGCDRAGLLYGMMVATPPAVAMWAAIGLLLIRS